VFNRRPVLHTFRVSQLYRLLGRNIAHFRHQANLTQEELAEKTDYSVDFIGLVERGVNAPTLARLEDIARVIRVEVWQLFYPSNEPDKQPARLVGRRSRVKGDGAARRNR
jgi:transcriptional regulator with XRE-family HTH domain